ncbi:hypothetical protein TNCV_4186231 [Trichonephila clavipes]|nr:hypothetical protein TNCV_4186231 [Trichonephila clavipes]
MKNDRQPLPHRKIIEWRRCGGAELLYRGGIILGSRTDLNAEIEPMASKIHWDIILKQHLRLFRGTMSTGFVFMEDNTRNES